MEEEAALFTTAQTICREISSVFANAETHSPNAQRVMITEIANTAKGGGRIAVHGVGREGLMMKALAMRLFHLGLSVSCVGDMTTPAIGNNDLLIASAGPGGFGTVDALCRRAKEAGARVVLLTAQPGGSAAKYADAVALVPAQTMADDKNPNVGVLPMGSLYEGAMFVLFEMVVLSLRAPLGQSAESMRERHTNLE